MPPPYYYCLKFELYPTPDPTATTADDGRGCASSSSSTSSATPDSTHEIWVPPPGASVFDDLPAHQPRTRQRKSSQRRPGLSGAYGHEDLETFAAAAAAAKHSRVIDCGGHRGGRTAHTLDEDNNQGSKPQTVLPLRPRARARGLSLPSPSVADGIGPSAAVRDWRFGRINIESFDLVGPGGDIHTKTQTVMTGRQESHGGGEGATPAASLGPNLGGMGLATKARYVPLETKNTEAGWGLVHLYREGDESSTLGEGSSGMEVESGPGEGNSAGVGGGGGGGGEEEDTILCIPAVPSYMSPSDFLGFVGEKWRGDVSHYRMVMTSRMSRYMVLMKFRDHRRAREWRKEFDGKPFDSVEVSCLPSLGWGLTEC